MAYLGSDPGFLGELTSAQQLDYLAELRGLPRRCWQQLAERLELDPTVRIRKLSRGNRQKIGVVAAFMGHEPLLILDEPTSGLDPLMQREFLALLAEAREAGRTVFLSSHNLVEVERACDRVAIIREGRIAEISNVGELLDSHWRSINLVLAHPPEASDFDLPNVEIAALTGREVHLMVRGDINPLLARIAAHDVADIAITTPDVEDLFLRQYRAEPPRRCGHDRLPPGAAAQPHAHDLARRLHGRCTAPSSPPCTRSWWRTTRCSTPTWRPSRRSSWRPSA